MKFRPLSKTVVTEIRSFVVDSVSKIGLYRQSVSASVKSDKPLDKKDFNISNSVSYTITDTSSLLSISCPEPIKATFVGLGPIIIAPPPTSSRIHYTATVTVPSTVVAGTEFPITISDLDLEAIVESIGAVVFNENTGETEHVECIRQPSGKYVGHCRTINSSLTGLNFDNSMNCYLGQKLQVIYSDPYNEYDIRENVVKKIDIKSPTETAVLTVREAVSIGKPIPIEIKDKDNTNSYVTVTLTNMVTGEQEVLNAVSISPGYFAASCPTKIYNNLTFTSGDNAIDVSIGHSVKVDYIDTRDLHGNVSLVTALVDIVGTITEVGSFVVNDTVEIDTDLDIVIKDYDLVGREIGVTVANTTSSEYRVVRLSEAVQGTGVFKGSLRLASIILDNTSLPAAVNDVLRLVYVDTGGSLTTVEKFVTVVAPVNTDDDIFPEEPEPDDTDDSEPVSTGTVEFLINGSFFLNGAFNGKVMLEGLHEEPTRCTIIVS